MQDSKQLESMIEVDGEQICIIADLYERRAPECARCVLRKVCNTPMSEDQLELVLDKINHNIARREYFEDLNEFYDDDTYSEV